MNNTNTNGFNGSQNFVKKPNNFNKTVKKVTPQASYFIKKDNISLVKNIKGLPVSKIVNIEISINNQNGFDDILVCNIKSSNNQVLYTLSNTYSSIVSRVNQVKEEKVINDIELDYEYLKSVIIDYFLDELESL